MTQNNLSSSIEKEELKNLGTHATGSPDQFKTRKTAETQTIHPPEEPNSGSTSAY
ncbi:hypothetical protein ACQCN2_02030 [Brevibacillus ginsengisoli]|uniref:hypothetical protein n=1 Tax=Brevibacillus ginsengisoli TaxID=363854 RepID=UPI003CEACD74